MRFLKFDFLENFILQIVDGTPLCDTLDELKTLAKTFEFDKLIPDEVVRDRIVREMSSDKLRETLLNKRDLRTSCIRVTECKRSWK